MTDDPRPQDGAHAHLRLFSFAHRGVSHVSTCKRTHTKTQVTEPFEDSSNWQLDPAYTGSSRGHGGEGEGTQATSEGADGSMQQPAYTLAIGEMEDEGVGEETTAKAAAFFDVSLDSSRVSARGAASPPVLGRSSGSSGGGGGGSAVGSGGRPESSTRAPGSSSGADGAASRQPTAAEMWMYGGLDGESGPQRME